MKLTIIRQEFTELSTIGSLYINDVFFCYTLEDKDRKLVDTDNIISIKAKKIFGKTCIPYGTYKVKLTMSNRFKRILPEILNVKGFSGVRIHRGNTHAHTEGCPLVGFKKGKDCIMESTKAEEALMERLKGFEDITLQIV